MSKLSVIGLGKLGAPLAAVLASKGHTVIGIDRDSRAVQAIASGHAPISEPGLEELIRSSRSRLTATSEFGESILGTDATFIIVPTPSDASGAFSMQYLVSAAESIGKALRNKPGYHLVVLTSTVMPGSTANTLLPLLESRSGKKCGPDFGLCYNPEFIALGTVIRDMLHPDFVLIGESDARAGDLLVDIHRSLYETKPVFARMNFVNAELTKLAINTYVTTKISYANMLAGVCERLPGADVDVVTGALGLDSRIGPKYLKGALGYGGPCFPRDNVAFAHLARVAGAEAPLAEATDRLNRQQVHRLAGMVFSKLREGGQVGILGLSYKPNTNVIEESQAMQLAHELLAHGAPIVVYDPAAMEQARLALGESAVFASSVSECARMVDVLVIATPWEEFRSLEPRDLKCEGGRPVLMDCWRMLDRRKFEGIADFIVLGRGYSARPEPVSSDS